MDGMIMTVNGRAFTIIKLLGKGKGGYSYLAQDEREQQYVLKQIHHEPCDYYQFGDKLASELNDYKRLKAIGIRIPLLLDCDKENERILKEYIDGPTIYELVLGEGIKPEFLDQMREMCTMLYAAGLNIDYFPTNFIVQDGLLYYIDYECNEFMPEWSFGNWGIKYWSRTPELLEYAEKHK